MSRPLCFIDVDTQHDFMSPRGALYVPRAETLLPVLERLTRFAVDNGIPLVSTMDAHEPDDPEFARFPPHCVRDTPGYRKIPETLLPDHAVIPNEPRAGDLPEAAQWLLEKQVFSLFDNANAKRLLRGPAAAARYVVYGVATEYCVRADVLDLLDRGLPVTLLTDAILPIDAAAGAAALAEMSARGAVLTTAEEFLASLEPQPA
jgi:nicotinamidase/pyrazinamidase